MLTPTRRVRRRNGSKVAMSQNITWAKEFSALWKHIQRKKVCIAVFLFICLSLNLEQTWLVFIPAFYSFFYGGVMGTYLSRHFSVRARALSTLITRLYFNSNSLLLCTYSNSSYYHYPHGCRIRQIIGYETVVSMQASLDRICPLAHSPGGMFYLDRY